MGKPDKRLFELLLIGYDQFGYTDLGECPPILYNTEERPIEEEATEKDGQDASGSTSPLKRERTNPGKLAEYTPASNNEYCATYAQRRQTGLGPTINGTACNYIRIFQNSVFQISADSNNLKTVVQAGDALVWRCPELEKYDPNNNPICKAIGPKGAKTNACAGHVAVIEEVFDTSVVISHSNWFENGQPVPEKEISLEQLRNPDLWVIPFN